jgi:hypothetical protein
MNETKKSYEKKLDLLTRPIWCASDIMGYFNVSKTTAYRIRKRTSHIKVVLREKE